MFEKWLSRIAFVHEGFSAFKGERREEDRRSTNREKRFSKTSNFSASSNVKETKQTQSDHCPLADGTHKIWNCPLFRNMSVNDRYAAVRNQRLCYGCLGKDMQSKIVKSMRAASMDASRSTTRLNTYAFLDSGSTVSFIDQSVQEKLRAEGTDVTLNLAGIHGAKDLKTKKFPLKIKGLNSKVHSMEAFAHPSIS